MTPTIYLTRHASPDHSYEGPYHLVPGPPLTAAGREEARALGGFLARAGVRRVLTSPLARCLRTAEIVGEVLEVPVERRAARVAAGRRARRRAGALPAGL